MTEIEKEKRLVNIPFFCGFYESLISYCIDDNINREKEYLEEEFHIDFSDWENEKHLCDYTVNYNRIGKSYVDFLSTKLELDSLEFESIIRPQYYNYETDRLFAYLSYRDIQKIVNESLLNPEILEKVVKERFTPYLGFSPNYSNDYHAFINKSILDFDHNELGTFLIVYAAAKLGKEKVMDINYDWYEDNGYEIIANSIEFSKELYDLRDKAAEE